MQFKTQPWKHQFDAFEFAKDKPGTMLAMDMGTGKSKVVCDIVVNNHYSTTLILCPKSVIPAWEKQFGLHTDGVRVVLLGGGATKKRAEEMLRAASAFDPVVIVTNYEAAISKAMRDAIIRIPWDMVVLDESHKIKAPGGKTSWLAKALRDRCRKRLCLTGTPMPHSPLDVYAQYRFLDPTIYGGTYQMFKMNYAVLNPRNEHHVVGFRNLEDLHEKFYQIAFRVKKSDVLDLPEETTQEAYGKLGDKAQGVYDDLQDNFIALMDSGVVTANNALTKLLRLQQVTSGYVGGVTSDGSDPVEVQVDRAKPNMLEETIEGIGADEPLVIFCRFTHDITECRKICENAGRATSELSGKESGLKDWQEGRTNTLVVQIQAGGVGIDMTRACYAIYYSMGFSLSDYEQSKARLHRPGQTRPVTYIHLLIEDSVDIGVMKALKNKMDVVNCVLEDLKSKGGDSRD